MKKLIIVLIVLSFNCGVVNAQNYNTGIGLRGGFSSGITLKHVMSDNNAIEGILATQHKGLLITLLYERHVSAFDVPGLFWYYGAGGHLGMYDENDPPGYLDNTYVLLGINGVVGLDYKIEEIPINISLDLMPRMHVVGYTGLRWGGGFSLRYVW